MNSLRALIYTLRFCYDLRATVGTWDAIRTFTNTHALSSIRQADSTLVPNNFSISTHRFVSLDDSHVARKMSLRTLVTAFVASYARLYFSANALPRSMLADGVSSAAHLPVTRCIGQVKKHPFCSTFQSLTPLTMLLDTGPQAVLLAYVRRSQLSISLSSLRRSPLGAFSRLRSHPTSFQRFGHATLIKIKCSSFRSTSCVAQGSQRVG